MSKYRSLRAPARLTANDSYTFLMKELEKVDEKILEPLTGTDWPRDMPVITGGGMLESIVSVDVTYASTGRNEDNLIFDATNDIPVVQADMSQSVARCFNFAEYMSFPNMVKLIQCKNGPEPLKSKGLRDLSQFSAAVLIVEKGWISWRSMQIGAYQHTKPNSHTIPEMNRVTVQWERVIVYQESCDSRLLQSNRPFFRPFLARRAARTTLVGFVFNPSRRGATEADVWAKTHWNAPLTKPRNIVTAIAFGPKVWHSNDKYRRVIWQCNNKYKGTKICRMPHLYEDRIEADFLKVCRKLSIDRDEIITNLRELQTLVGGTEELEKERADLEIERNLLADRLQALIDRNAKEAQDQVKYIKQYDELSGKYKKAEEKLTRLDTRIRDKEMRNRRITDFIDAVEQMPDTVSEFSTELWATLIDQVTVYGKKDVRFTLSTGEEIQVD